MKPGPVIQAQRGSSNYHQRELCMQLWQLRTNFTLCDVALKVGGTLIPAHRIVLCASSPVLLVRFAILNHPMGAYLDLTSECVSFDTCHSVLEYMYTGVVPNPPKKRLPELEWLVDHWQLTSLQAKLAAKQKYKRGSSAGKTLAISTVSKPGENQRKALPVSTINTNALDHPYFKDVYRGKNVEGGQSLVKGDISDSTEPLPISTDELVEEEYCACECKHESDDNNDDGNDECGKPDESTVSGDKVVVKEETDFAELLFGSNAPSPAIQFQVTSTDYQSPTEIENEIYRVLTNSDSGKEVVEATSPNSNNLERAITETEAQSVESVQTPDETTGDLEGSHQPQDKDSNFDSQCQRSTATEYQLQLEEEDDGFPENSSPTKGVTNSILYKERDSSVGIIGSHTQNTELECSNGTSTQCYKWNERQLFQSYDGTLFQIYHDSTAVGNGTFLISNATTKEDLKTHISTSTVTCSPPNISGSEIITIVPNVNQGESSSCTDGTETTLHGVISHNAHSNMKYGPDTNISPSIEGVQGESSFHLDEDLQRQHFQLDGLPELEDIHSNENLQEYSLGNSKVIPRKDNTKVAKPFLPAPAEMPNIGVFLQPLAGKDKEQGVEATESMKPGPLSMDKQFSVQFPEAARAVYQIPNIVQYPEPKVHQNVPQQQQEGKSTLVFLKIVPRPESGKLQNESNAQYVLAMDTGLRRSGAFKQLEAQTLNYHSHGGVQRGSTVAVHLPQPDNPTHPLQVDTAKQQEHNALCHVPAQRAHVIKLPNTEVAQRLPPEKPHKENQHLSTEHCERYLDADISKKPDMFSEPCPIASLAKAQSSETLHSQPARRIQGAHEVIPTSLREEDQMKTSNISFPLQDTGGNDSELSEQKESNRSLVTKKKPYIGPSPLKKVKHIYTLKRSPAERKTKCIRKVILTQLSKDCRKATNISNPQEKGSERKKPKTLLLKNKTSNIDADQSTLGEVVGQRYGTTAQYFPTGYAKDNSFKAQETNIQYKRSSPHVQADGNISTCSVTPHLLNQEAAEKVICNDDKMILCDKRQLHKQKINQIGERLLAELQNKTGPQRLWYKGNELFCNEIAKSSLTGKTDGTESRSVPYAERENAEWQIHRGFQDEPDKIDEKQSDNALDLSQRTASQTKTTEKAHANMVKISSKKLVAVQHQNSSAKPESETNHHSQEGKVVGPLTRCHASELLGNPSDSKRQKGDVGKCVLTRKTKLQSFHPIPPKRLKLQNIEQLQMSSFVDVCDAKMPACDGEVAEVHHGETLQGMQNSNTGLNWQVHSLQLEASKKVGIENIPAEKTNLLQNANSDVQTTNCKTSEFDQHQKHGRKKQQSKVVERLLLKKMKLQALQRVQKLELQNLMLQSLIRTKYVEQMSSVKKAEAEMDGQDNTGIKVVDVLHDRNMSNSSELSSVKNKEFNISNHPERPIMKKAADVCKIRRHSESSTMEKEGYSMIGNSESPTMKIKEYILSDNPESSTAKAQAFNSGKDLKRPTVKDQSYSLSNNLRPPTAMAEEYNLGKTPEALILTTQENNLDKNPESPTVEMEGYNLSRNPEPTTVVAQDCNLSKHPESPTVKTQDLNLSNNPEPPTVQVQMDDMSQSLTPPTILVQDHNISTNPKSPTTKAQAYALGKSQTPPAGKTQDYKFSNILIPPIVMASIKPEPPITKTEDSSMRNNLEQLAVKTSPHEQYVCTDCLMLFEDYALLTVHRECFHTKTKHFICNICNLSFETESKLQTHDTEHHWRDGIVIDLTLYIDDEDSKLKCHQQRDRKDDPSARHKLNKQVQEYSSQEGRQNAALYYCEHPHCAYKTHEMKILSKHRQLHAVIPAKKRRLVTCEQCGKSYLNARCLAKHKKQDHKQAKLVASERLWCTLCTFTSLSKSNLAEHLWKKHDLVKEGKARYKCSFCDFKTLQSSIFKIHKTTHKPGQDKQFVCDVCGRRYHKASGLKKHMKYHTGDAKLYSCPHCDYVAVNNKTTLQTHIQLIHEHKGEKRFPCDECDYACNYRGNLYKHLRQVHKKEPCVKDKGKKTTQKNANLGVHQKKAQRKTKKGKKYQVISKAALKQSKPYIVL